MKFKMNFNLSIKCELTAVSISIRESNTGFEYQQTYDCIYIRDRLTAIETAKRFVFEMTEDMKSDAYTYSVLTESVSAEGIGNIIWYIAQTLTDPMDAVRRIL